MAEFAVNIVLILSLVVLLTASLIGAIRRRRRDRRQHAEERRLILQAFLGAAAEPTRAAAPGDATRASVAVPRQLDAASVAQLLDLLEDRRPVRRGVLTGLVSGPRSVWAVGARAGQHVGRRMMGQRAEATEQAGPALVRAAAGELLDIHAHDPSAAQLEYRRYAAALGDPALAELYVHSAAHGTYADHDQVREVVGQIISGPQLGNRPPVERTMLA